MGGASTHQYIGHHENVNLTHLTLDTFHKTSRERINHLQRPRMQKNRVKDLKFKMLSTSLVQQVGATAQHKNTKVYKRF